MQFQAGVGHVAHSLRRVCAGGFIKEGAEPRQGSSIGQLSIWLESSLNGDYHAQTQCGEDLLLLQTSQITGNIINAKDNSEGNYICTIRFGHKSFEISQTSDRPNVIEIRDLHSGDTEIIKGVTFPALQKQLLNQYIREQFKHGYKTVDLRLFNLVGIDVRGIDFSLTVINYHNFQAMFDNGAKFNETITIDKDGDWSKTSVGNQRPTGRMDKSFARSLICAGACSDSGIWELFLFPNLSEVTVNTACADDQQKEAALVVAAIFDAQKVQDKYQCTVRIAGQEYVVSELDTGSICIQNAKTGGKAFLHNQPWAEMKKSLLFHYIKENNYQLLDLSSINLNGDLSGISFANTALSRENFNVIVAGGASLVGARLKMDADIQNLQLVGLTLDYTMANSLIVAGMDVKTVLISYLDTPRHMASCRLKTTMLKNCLAHEVATGRRFDLCSVNLRDVNCEDLDLSKTVLDADNVEAIIATNGNLSGAILAKGMRAPVIHYLDMVRMDKAMAIQLIEAGASTRAVLCNYLSTERALGHIDIDISGIDVSNVNIYSIDWRGVNKKNIQFLEISEFDQEYVATIQDNFQQDLLRLLTLFSSKVAETLKASSTLDNVYRDQLTDGRTLSPEMVEKKNHINKHYSSHFSVVSRNLDRYGARTSDGMHAMISASSGNCAEMAVMLKALLDAYLSKSLSRLGYHNVVIKSIISSGVGEDHAFVKVECLFWGVKSKYLADAWSDGQAWTYEKGVSYFRSSAPDRFVTRPHEFEVQPEWEWTANLEEVQYQQRVNAIFEKFKLDEAIDAAITQQKLDFAGFPDFAVRVSG